MVAVKGPAGGCHGGGVLGFRINVALDRNRAFNGLGFRSRPLRVSEGGGIFVVEGVSESVSKVLALTVQ